MKPILRALAHSQLLFAVCAAAYLGLLGPWLISAASTLYVLCGIALLAALAAWAFVLFGRPNHKGN